MAAGSEMSRVNFNPDFMGTTLSSSTDGGGVRGEGRNCQTNNPNGTPNINYTILAPPKFSKNHYGPDVLLALFTVADTTAPSRLKDFTDFYLPTAQNPICMAPFSETEQRLLLQGGINSSKVMNVVNHAERQQRWTQQTPWGGGGGSGVSEPPIVRREPPFPLGSEPPFVRGGESPFARGRLMAGIDCGPSKFRNEARGNSQTNNSNYITGEVSRSLWDLNRSPFTLPTRSASGPQSAESVANFFNSVTCASQLPKNAPAPSQTLQSPLDHSILQFIIDREDKQRRRLEEEQEKVVEMQYKHRREKRVMEEKLVQQREEFMLKQIAELEKKTLRKKEKLTKTCNDFELKLKQQQEEFEARIQEIEGRKSGRNRLYSFFFNGWGMFYLVYCSAIMGTYAANPLCSEFFIVWKYFVLNAIVLAAFLHKFSCVGYS